MTGIQKSFIALAILLCYGGSTFAQHGLQIDDGSGHISTIVSTNPPGTYVLPPGGGEILTFTPGVSPAWLCGGNTNPISNVLGTLSATDLVIRTNNITRATFSNAPSATTPMLSLSNTTAGIQGLRINGSLDATATSTLAANPGVWDLVVNGDEVVTGVFKTGGSFWFDGNSLTHSIRADKPIAIKTTSNDSLMFSTNGLTRMTFAAGGNVGIGTMNPVSPLHIVGTPANPTLLNAAGFLVPDPSNHVLTVENLATASKGNGIAVIIHNPTGQLLPFTGTSDGAYNNNASNYVTFYNAEGDHTHIKGRIEGFSYENYDEMAQAIFGIVSNADVYNPFSYFTCNLGFDANFIHFDPNFISITWPTFPTVNAGSWPTISSSFTISGGSLPYLSGGSIGSISFSNPINPFPPSSPITNITNPFSLNMTFINDIASQLNAIPYKSKAAKILSNPLEAAVNFGVSFLGGVSFESGSGDYAEWLERADHNETVTIGDVVGVVGGKITKNTVGANQLMVVSWKPCVLGNTPEVGKEQFYNKVAFMGQIPVKVFGTARKGDYILPDGHNLGIAKAVSPEHITDEQLSSVLGVSWEDASDPSIKFVKIAVGLKPNELVKVIQDHATEITELKAKVLQLNQLKTEVAQMKSALPAKQAKASKKKSKQATQLSSN